MAEGARLESVYMGDCIEGSNPFLSATWDKSNLLELSFFFYKVLFKIISETSINNYKIKMEGYSYNFKKQNLSYLFLNKKNL